METMSLKEHNNGVRSVVFSPDGQQLASASEDATIKIWDARLVEKDAHDTAAPIRESVTAGASQQPR
jgi:WD40 repeat protein